jgi:RNA polymerase sigma-70 factor (ECF subfamily)
MDHDGTDTTPSIDASAVMRSWIEPLRGFLAKRVASPADVDDILQDIFLRLAERPDALDEVEHVSGWIHRIARNTVVDFYRRRGRAASTPGEAPDLDGSELERAGEAVAGGSPGATPLRDLAACMAPIVERMPEPYREALVLTELEGLTQVEAARRVGISLSGMKSRVQRGREQLRNHVLACCDVELDRRRGITEFASKPGGCGCSSR